MKHEIQLFLDENNAIDVLSVIAKGLLEGKGGS